MPLPRALLRPIRRVEARLRLQRAANAGALLLVPGAGLAAVVLGAWKAGLVADGDARGWLVACAALPALGLLVGALRPVPRLLAAQLLDRAHALRSRVANALEFAALPSRTPFMEAAVDDAAAHAATLDPSRALPLRLPRDLVPAVALVGLALFVAALEVPVARRVLPPPAIPPMVLDPDSLEAFEGELAELLAEAEPEPDVQAAARELNRILEDIADRRLDRTEALREIAELERRLAEGRSADAELMEEAMREMGRRLQGPSELVRAASEALRDADAARAERAMRELADQVRAEAMSRAELAELRRSLERAARERTAAEEAMQRREEELESLLQRRREELAQQDQEQSLLRRRQRELERLERERTELAEQRRQLERLRREMQRSAEDLNRSQRESAADAMQRGAEDLNRMAREQMSEEQRRQLEEQMRQLREMIRRHREQQQQAGGQGQGGQGQDGQGGQQQRLQRYVLRAQGQGGQPMRLRMPGQGQAGQQGGQAGQQGGQPGQGGAQAGQQGGQAGQQGGQPGQGGGQAGQGPGQAGQGGGQPGQGGGQAGQGQGGEAVMELTMGQGGNAILELPGMGEGEGQQGSGQGGMQGGSGAGTEHDPDMLDDPTRLQSRTQSSRVEGQHGEGPSRSEVILGAADRGFANRPYRQVYTDYANHAEEVLERDEVPPGYRFYVRRYFQLIRPRDGAAGAAERPGTESTP